MKKDIRTLTVHPAGSANRDGETAHVAALGTAQFAETLKSIARRTAAASSQTVGPDSAFGCVDWFRYPSTASNSSGATDPARS